MAIVELLQAANPFYIYAALFGILVVEGLGLPWVPYEPLFLVTAIAAKTGKVNMLIAVLVGALGNLAGNIAGYQISRKAGLYLVEKHGRLLGVGRAQLEAAHRWFERYGSLTTFAARFIGIIRTPAIIGAGIAGMDLRRFMFYSGLGGALWCIMWLYGSALVSQPLLALLNSYGTWVGIATLLLFPIAMVISHRLTHRTGEKQGGKGA